MTDIAGLVDLHHHVLPPDYVRRLGDRLGFQGLRGTTPDWSPEISLAAMERNGIAKAVTSVSAPGFWFGDPGETKELTRACNEYAAALVRAHPGRFGFFAALPLPDVDASLAEIAHACDVLAADGIALMSNYGGRYPGDAAFSPVLDALNRRGAAVFIHPTGAGYGRYMEAIPPPTLEFPFDTTRAVTSLLYGGVLARCPDVRFVLPHAGGTVPFLAHRIARLTINPAFAATVPQGGVIEALRRLYYDTALSANELAFAPLLKLADPARIVFGSDYPHAGEPTLRDTVEGLRRLDLACDLMSRIAHGNARDLLASTRKGVA